MNTFQKNSSIIIFLLWTYSFGSAWTVRNSVLYVLRNDGFGKNFFSYFTKFKNLFTRRKCIVLFGAFVNFQKISIFIAKLTIKKIVRHVLIQLHSFGNKFYSQKVEILWCKINLPLRHIPKNSISEMKDDFLPTLFFFFKAKFPIVVRVTNYIRVTKKWPEGQLWIRNIARLRVCQVPVGGRLHQDRLYARGGRQQATPGRRGRGQEVA
jgi:hypothetical protein